MWPTPTRVRCWCRRFVFGWNGGFRCGACTGLALMLLFTLTADSIRDHRELKEEAARKHERIAADPSALEQEWTEWRQSTRDQPWALKSDRESLERYRAYYFPQLHPRYWGSTAVEELRLAVGLLLYVALMFGSFYPSPVRWRTPAKKLPWHPEP